VAYPVSTGEVLTTESQRDVTSMQEEMPAHTESVQRLLKEPPYHWTTILLARNQLMGILIAFKVLQLIYYFKLQNMLNVVVQILAGMSSKLTNSIKRIQNA
jgi:hypothetical protein